MYSICTQKQTPTQKQKKYTADSHSMYLRSLYRYQINNWVRIYTPTYASVDLSEFSRQFLFIILCLQTLNKWILIVARLYVELGQHSLYIYMLICKIRRG